MLEPWFELRNNDGLRNRFRLVSAAMFTSALVVERLVRSVAERSLRRPLHASACVHDALARRWIWMDREHQEGCLHPALAASATSGRFGAVLMRASLLASVSSCFSERDEVLI